MNPTPIRKARHIECTNASSVEIKPLNWLWNNRIPLGKLSLLGGDPGLGKTLVSIDIIARVTTGRSFPDKGECPRGACAILASEDDAADTIAPRLQAAGADLNQVMLLGDVIEPNGRITSYSLQNISLLEEVLRSIPNIRLLVIDPLKQYCAGVDTHKNADTRAILAPLTQMAARLEIAVIGIEHLNKSTSETPLHRLSGSIAFVAAARAAFAITKDQDDPTRRLMLPLKANLSKETPGLAYSVIDHDGLPIVQWELEPVTQSAEEAFSTEEQIDRKFILEETKAALIELLINGARKRADVFRDLKKQDFTDSTIKRAACKLGIESIPNGRECIWQLPEALVNKLNAERFGSKDPQEETNELSELPEPSEPNHLSNLVHLDHKVQKVHPDQTRNEVNRIKIEAALQNTDVDCDEFMTKLDDKDFDDIENGQLDSNAIRLIAESYYPEMVTYV